MLQPQSQALACYLLIGSPCVPHIDFSGNLGFVLSNLPAGFVKSDSTGQAGITLHSDALIHLKALRMRPE